MLKFINASISRNRPMYSHLPVWKEKFLLGTQIPHVSRGHLAYLNWGGNFLLGEAAKIFNIKSLNISVTVKLCQQAMNCSENHRILKEGKKKRQFFSHLHPHLRLGFLWLCLESVWPTSMKYTWGVKPDSSQEVTYLSQTAFFLSQKAVGIVS